MNSHPQSTDDPVKPEIESDLTNPIFRSFSHPIWFKHSEAATLITPEEKGNEAGAYQTSRLPQSTRRRRFSGWRFGVTVCGVTVIVVFLINAILTIWVAANPRFPMRNGLGLLYRGSCSTSKRATIWLHLAINILSTLLLSAGNYCMQFLSAPTRQEVDRAHAEKKWLHIGVPSFKNLRAIGRDRLILWGILAASSLPLHLVFNSVVFSTLQANQYLVVTASEDFMNGGTWDSSGLLGVHDPSQIVEAATSLRDRILSNRTKFEKLDTNRCLQTYSSQFVSDKGDVLLIQDRTIFHNVSGYAAKWTNATHYEWISSRYASSSSDGSGLDRWWNGSAWESACLGVQVGLPYRSVPGKYMSSNDWLSSPAPKIPNSCPFQTPPTVAMSDPWAPYGDPVRYCYSEIVDESCELHFSLAFALAVMAANLAKACCIFYILKNLPPKSRMLVTIGDAIASFLDGPDPHTHDMCCFPKSLVHEIWEKNLARTTAEQIIAKGQTWPPKRRRWGSSASMVRWFASYGTYYVGLAAAGIFISGSLQVPSVRSSDMLKRGFGSVNYDTLLPFDTSMLGGVLLANAAQLVPSYLYVTLNSLFTCMLVGYEWSRYSSHRKPLRVSSPAGKQRSTYHLQLPLTYALPLMILSALIHWGASQSIFYVQLRVVDRDRQISPDPTISTCAYSPNALILLMILATVVIAWASILALRRYPPGMALASSSSAAISAACHPRPDDPDASLLPVQWGVVSTEGECGHCSFSSMPVSSPIPGQRYAGLAEATPFMSSGDRNRCT